MSKIEFVVIVDRANGNESVGTMWKETNVFGPSATLLDVMVWAGTRSNVVVTVTEDSKTI